MKMSPGFFMDRYLGYVLMIIRFGDLPGRSGALAAKSARGGPPTIQSHSSGQLYR